MGPKTRQSVSRIIYIWLNHNIFPAKFFISSLSFSLSRFSKKFKSLSTSEERPGSSCFTRLKSALARSISHMKPNALPLLRIENQIVSLWMSPVPRLRETCASATRKGKNCGSQRFHVSIHQHWMLHCLICANKVIWDGLTDSQSRRLKEYKLKDARKTNLSSLPL